MIQLVEKERNTLLLESEKKGYLNNKYTNRIYYLTRNIFQIDLKNLELIDSFDYFTIMFKEQEIIELKAKIKSWNLTIMKEFKEVNFIRKKK